MSHEPTVEMRTGKCSVIHWLQVKSDALQASKLSISNLNTKQTGGYPVH